VAGFVLRNAETREIPEELQHALLCVDALLIFENNVRRSVYQRTAYSCFKFAAGLASLSAA
jgi:hypothetical protein